MSPAMLIYGLSDHLAFFNLISRLLPALVYYERFVHECCELSGASGYTYNFVVPALIAGRAAGGRSRAKQGEWRQYCDVF